MDLPSCCSATVAHVHATWHLRMRGFAVPPYACDVFAAAHPGREWPHGQTDVTAPCCERAARAANSAVLRWLVRSPDEDVHLFGIGMIDRIAHNLTDAERHALLDTPVPGPRFCAHCGLRVPTPERLSSQGHLGVPRAMCSCDTAGGHVPPGLRLRRFDPMTGDRLEPLPVARRSGTLTGALGGTGYSDDARRLDGMTPRRGSGQ